MKTKTLSEDISYNLKTYLNEPNVSSHVINSIGAEYFTDIEFIPEIIESFEKYKIVNDYISIIMKMRFYVEKAFYQKQCDFNSFSKYALDKFFDIEISQVLNSDELEEQCHEWCLEVLERCNYKF